LFTLVLSLLSAGLSGQQSAEEYVRGASQAVSERRYEEIDGNPYRYSSYRPAFMLDAVLNRYDFDSLNYNGYSGRFEYVEDGKLRELSQRTFLRATVMEEDGSEHLYVWSANPRFSDQYAEVLFRGDFVTATLVYTVVADEKSAQTPGSAARGRRFNVKRYYYAQVNGELTTLSARAKKLAEELGHSRQIREFIKENDLKPGRREDLIRVLTFADTLF
jgi:hypothetical protein